MRPSLYPPHGQYPRSIRLLKATNYAFTHLYHRTRVLSPLRLPARGRAILVCNHISGLDPLVLQSGCRRIIRWMMASEYYHLGSLHWLFKRLDAIPVQRDGRDTSATRAALRALKQEQVVGIFPEGKIEMTPELLDFQTGAAMLAYRSGAPIYPAYIEGIPRGLEMLASFVGRQDCVVAFGPRIEAPQCDPGRQELVALTARVRRAVQALQQRVRGALDRRLQE